MSKDFIGYQALVDNAIENAWRDVVREALRLAEKNGLVGGHHFFISFETRHPGVEIPDHLRERYPDEIQIVLQNKFWDLKVDDDKFEVTLTFQKLPATLVVPFAAITNFVDPSVKFGLQFRNASQPLVNEPVPSPEKKTAQIGQGSSPAAPEATPHDGDSQIVSLDKFRKK